MKFLKVNKAFANKNEGTVNSPFILCFLETNTGDIVVSKDAEVQFKKIFKDHTFETVTLNASDFKPDYTSLAFVVDGLYKVLKRIENYKKQEVEIIYIKNGKEISLIIDQTNQVIDNQGYTLNMTNKIRANEA